MAGGGGGRGLGTGGTDLLWLHIDVRAPRHIDHAAVMISL